MKGSESVFNMAHTFCSLSFLLSSVLRIISTVSQLGPSYGSTEPAELTSHDTILGISCGNLAVIGIDPFCCMEHIVGSSQSYLLLRKYIYKNKSHSC